MGKFLPGGLLPIRYVDMKKVEVILKVGRCGVESETEGGL